MKNTFAQIASTVAPRWKRNAFDLSHYRRMSANQGELIPTLVLECVPGDSFRINQEILTRFSPLISPVYEDIEMFTHFFKVPYYMIMRRAADTGNGGWEDFITNDPEGNYTNTYIPYIEITDSLKAYFYEGQLADYLGYPVTDSGTTIHANAQVTVNMFRALAYWLIRDEYYRDQNLQESLSQKMGYNEPDYPYGSMRNWISEADHIFASRPLPVCWEKDYFTSALPYAHDPANTSVEYDLDTLSGTKFQLSANAGGTVAPAAGALSVAGYDVHDSAAADTFLICISGSTLT